MIDCEMDTGWSECNLLAYVPTIGSGWSYNIYNCFFWIDRLEAFLPGKGKHKIVTNGLCQGIR